MDFSETIEVKVLDKNSSFAMDSYFFAYFHDLPSALDQLRDAVRTHRSAGEEAILDRALEVLDTTTASRVNNQPYDIERQVSSETGRLSAVTSGFRLPSILRPFHTSTIETHDTIDSVEGFTHITKRQNSASFVPVCASPEPTINTTLPDTGKLVASEKGGTQSKLLTSTPSKLPVPNHTYPPSTEHTQLSSRDSYVSGISGGIANVSNWVKNTRARSLFGTSESSGTILGAVPGVKEIYSSSSSRWSGATGDMFSILESPDTTIDDDVVEKFRSAFAYDEREKLLGCKFYVVDCCSSIDLSTDFTGYIFRLLPVHGKLYVSSNHFCFKSSGPLTSRTKVCLLYHADY
jgi:sterol 3beta-glucosyltransferase